MVFALNITDLWSRWTKGLIITLRNLTRYNKSKDIIERDNSTRVFEHKLSVFSLYILTMLSCGSELLGISLTTRRGKTRWLYWKWQSKFVLIQTQTYWVRLHFINRSKEELHWRGSSTYEAGRGLTQAIYLLYLLQYFINQKQYSPQ